MFQNQSGRSMVEMLGVLAIIGVLSIGGIAGYRQAMTAHRANEFLNDLSIFFISARSAIEGGQVEGNIKIKNQNWFYTATFLIGNSGYDFAAVIPETVDVATCKELATRINDSTFDALRGAPQVSEDFYFYTTTSGEDWMQRGENERKQTCESGANSSGQVHFYMGF